MESRDLSWSMHHQFQECDLFRRQFPTLIDQRVQTSIDRKHPKIIDAIANNLSLPRPVSPSLHWRFSMICQMRMTTPFDVELGSIPFLLRNNFQSYLPNSKTDVHLASAFDS